MGSVCGAARHCEDCHAAMRRYGTHPAHSVMRRLRRETMSANLESRVLVVDDCEPLRYLKTQYLLEAGFHVSQADTGRAALRSIETERPDLVLLDVNLPDMHGSEVCREVKTRWDLPVIYTSSVDVPAELHGMADGCLVDRKSTRLNSSHLGISYAVFC